MMSDPNPDISVVVGAKNARLTIVACLESLYKQTEAFNAEIIVAD